MSKYFYRTSVAALALPLAVAGITFAETPRPADPAIQKELTKQMSRETSVPVRASKLIGMDVANHQDKSLGEIKDIVLDSTGQSIGYAVVAYGGFLGMGDKLFAIPYNSLEYSSVEDSRIYLGIDEQSLKNAPGFNKDQWPDKADSAAYFKQADQYYDRNTMAQPAGARMEAGKVVGTPVPITEGLNWNRRLSSLIGSSVLSPTGESLGEIKDVIIDWRSCKVQYNVLSFGGVMGFGDKLFAVPTTAFKSKSDAKELVLAIDQQQLKNAPGFDKDNWPNFTDETWRKTNDQFYMPHSAKPLPDK